MPIQVRCPTAFCLPTYSVNTLRSQGGGGDFPGHAYRRVLIQVPDHLVEPSVRVVVDTMHDVGFDTEVNFAMEVEVGKRWGEMKTVYNG